MALLVMRGDLKTTQGSHSSQEFRAVKVPAHHTEAQKGEITYSRTHGARKEEAKPEFLSLTALCSLLFDAALGSFFVCLVKAMASALPFCDYLQVSGWMK